MTPATFTEVPKKLNELAPSTAGGFVIEGGQLIWHAFWVGDAPGDDPRETTWDELTAAMEKTRGAGYEIGQIYNDHDSAYFYVVGTKQAPTATGPAPTIPGIPDNAANRQAVAQASGPDAGPDLREQLAAYAHDAWSGWMKYLFEKGEFVEREVHRLGNIEKTWMMPAWAVERWTRQMNTPYADLPEGEKASDRQEADRMLAIMGHDAGPDEWEEVPKSLEYDLMTYAIRHGVLPEGYRIQRRTGAR